MKFKKILGILGVTLTFSLIVSLVLATNFVPFIQDNVLDVKIIYGDKAAVSDFDSASDIDTDLINRKEVQVIVIRNESFLIKSRGKDLNFGESLNEVITKKLTDEDLPKILADGSVEYDDGSDVDYTQILKLGDNSITFGSLDEEDYIINTDYSQNEKPILYLDSNGVLWSLIVEFDDPFDATNVENKRVINIAGNEYTFSPNMEDEDDELVLFVSSQKVPLSLNEAKTVNVNGKTITFELIGANEEEVFLKINDETKKITEGNSITVNGVKVYANNVFIRTIPEDTVDIELFIGADELTISMESGDFSIIEVNDERLKGIETKVTGDIDAIEKIEFRFLPIEMEDVEDEIEFLEVGETIIDPLFKTISITFDSIQLDSEDRDFLEIDSIGDEVEITFTNLEGDEIIFIPYEEKDDVLVSNFVQGNNATEDKIFITQVDDITEIFEIEEIDDDEVEIYSYTEDEFRDYEVGDFLKNTDVEILAINNSRVYFNVNASNVLYTENNMKVSLLSDSISFDESGIEFDESGTISTVTEVNLLIGNHIEIGSVEGPNITQAHDNDGNIEYTVTNGYATYFVRDSDDDRNLKVYIPEEETDFDVYISESIEVVDDDETYTLITKDTEMEAEDLSTNMIVVGGPCINTFAAELLNSNDPICGEDFTYETGVESGQYLIEIFDNPTEAGKIIVLIAGYNAEDTVNGVSEFLKGELELTIGQRYIK